MNIGRKKNDEQCKLRNAKRIERLKQIPLSTFQLCLNFVSFNFVIESTTITLRASSDYAQVERRSVTFLDQTMSRGEAFGLKKYIKIIECQF